MPTDTSRLAEARKQIGLVADRLEDPELVEDLQDAEALVDGVEAELVESD